jgi:ABC-type branched-chain amino acid transport system, permease component
MSTAELQSTTRSDSPPSAPPRFARGDMVTTAVTAVLLLIVLVALPQILNNYYVDAMTQVAVYAIVALGLGVLVGRVGLVSLGQAAVLAIGAWVAARLLFGTSLPYELVLLASGLITMMLGTLVGLPALRMRGLYLALITLMLAGAIGIVRLVRNTNEMIGSLKMRWSITKRIGRGQAAAITSASTKLT